MPASDEDWVKQRVKKLTTFLRENSADLWEDLKSFLSRYDDDGEGVGHAGISFNSVSTPSIKIFKLNKFLKYKKLQCSTLWFVNS